MKWVRIIGIIVCAAGLLFSGYHLFKTEKEYSEIDKAYEAIADELVSDSEPSAAASDSPAQAASESESKTEIGTGFPISIDFEAALKNYPELRGWIYSEGTQINYPIMQTDNDDYYLDHLPNGEYKISGSLFMECSNAGDFSDGNTIIYGHNMTNESMFGSLRNYREQSYYSEHPNMYLATPDGNYRLDVLAGFDTTIYSSVYQPVYEWNDMPGFIAECKNQSCFKSDTGDNYDHVVVLSTCSTQQDLRFVVVCGLVKLSESEQ